MANLKYNEETKIVTFRVPESKVKVFREKVNDILKSFKPKEEVKKISCHCNDEETRHDCYATCDYVEKIKIPTTEKKCDCYLDSNSLLRRGKIKCTKTKKQHKF